jgi:glycosyltransferase involved in cell wall biosynthesis
MDVKDSPRILYISYDGLTDPLGQSQILPYVKGLAAAGHRFTILSFEKKERFEKERGTVEQLTGESNIEWVPVSFTSRPPLVSKFYDAIRMRHKAFELQRSHRFDMVHCRSYIAADIGLQMKRRFGIKFFFDMRGFWPDEKKDGGHWKMSNPIFRQVYSYYKKKEGEYLQNADYIISLTEAGKKEMLTWRHYNATVPIDIIPCCADMQLFSLTDEEQKRKGRKVLGIASEKLVLSYLGSLGTWYMLDEMLKLFQKVKKVYSGAYFLFVTPSNPRMILDKLSAYGLKQSDIKIVEARRHEVPIFIKASDINISFIKPVYSKLSSSPTKLGEVLSMGIPVISNNGVGDVEKIIRQVNGGYIFQDFTEQEYKELIDVLPSILSKDPGQIRCEAETIYNLSKGVESYIKAYNSIFKRTSGIGLMPYGKIR